MTSEPVTQSASSAHLPGQVPGTLQVLTGEQARELLPDLFQGTVDEPYFYAVDGSGNGDWVDFWPDRVLVVRNAGGDVVVAANAPNYPLPAPGWAPHPSARANTPGILCP